MSYNPSGPSGPSGPGYSAGGGPGYSPGGPSGPMVSQASIQDVVNSWIASVTQPNVQTYANELARFSQNRLLISVGLATVISTVLGLLGGLLSHNLVGDLVSGLIGVPLAFFIGQGVIYLIAKIFGGTGDYMQQSWVFSTFWAPMLIVQHIPIIGAVVSGLAFLYSLYLTYLALQPVHRLDTQKSLFVVLTLLAIGVALVACAFVFFAAIFFGAAATAR